MGLFTRAIRPPEEPNGNDPASVPPATVGPPAYSPGDPSGVTVEASPPSGQLPTIVPSPWSGWPAEWGLAWGSSSQSPTGIAWTCINKNADALATMPPYLVGAAPTLDSAWLTNPNPDQYTSWEEFAKQLFRDFQLGEAFVLATARYSTGWPARFHVVAPWYVQVEIDNGIRRYTIGNEDVTQDMLHLRYCSTVGDAHGHGPLEAAGEWAAAAAALTRYATTLVTNGGIPTSVLEHPDELSAQQSADLRAQWVQARISAIGEPAVLSGGVTWRPVQINPSDMALDDLTKSAQSRIAVALGVPPFLVGLPAGGDSMTYSNVESIFDYHWRDGLRPKAQMVLSGLSEWLLPRGTSVELNRDAYIQPGPLQRAQTAQILAGLGALSVNEIRDRERLDDTVPQPLAQGVFK